MKRAVIFVFIAFLFFGASWFADDFVAPLFFNSRIERLGEKGLPKAWAETGDVIYCRMKADDFRFRLPPGSRVLSQIIVSGGFDTVHGSVQVIFDKSRPMSPSEYENWVSTKMQSGGYVTAEPIPDGLTIKFHYFGDR